MTTGSYAVRKRDVLPALDAHPFDTVVAEVCHVDQIVCAKCVSIPDCGCDDQVGGDEVFLRSIPSISLFKPGYLQPIFLMVSRDRSEQTDQRDTTECLAALAVTLGR